MNILCFYSVFIYSSAKIDFTGKARLGKAAYCGMIRAYSLIKQAYAKGRVKNRYKGTVCTYAACFTMV
jgi:hypothetical protein